MNRARRELDRLAANARARLGRDGVAFAKRHPVITLGGAVVVTAVAVSRRGPPKPKGAAGFLFRAVKGWLTGLLSSKNKEALTPHRRGR